MLKLGKIGKLIAVCLLFWMTGYAQDTARRVRVGLSDWGGEQVGRVCAVRLADALAADKTLLVNDLGETQAALRGAGYDGSLNLTIEQARDLGGATGNDYYFLARTVTEELSDLTRPKYAAAYLALVLVSSRTGRLVLWREIRAEAATPEAAGKALPDLVATHAQEFATAIQSWEKQELQATIDSRTNPPALIPEAPEADSPAAQGLRLPAPYRRLTPAYPATAARVQAVGTVDVMVALDAQGAVLGTEIVRWAGFGLDEAAAENVRRMNFRPAQRDGKNVPLRVLLRYNFRPAPVSRP